MAFRNPHDSELREILTQTQVIALVGYSEKRDRPSSQIGQFLQTVGYKVIPVNSNVQQIEGQPCYASLRDIPEPVDLVNVFRRSEFLPEIVEAAIAIQAKTL